MNDKGKGIMEQNDSDFGDNYDDESPPDEGHMLSYLIHRTCHTPHVTKDPQITNLLRTRGTILGKVCDIIVDNGSTDNLISDQAVKKLGLRVENHPKPYKVGWIKKRDSV